MAKKPKIEIVGESVKDAAVYLRLGQGNKDYVQALADKSNVSFAECVDQIITQLRAQKAI